MSKKNSNVITVTFNIRSSALEAARGIAKLNGISISEAINRAVETEKFLQDERTKGSQVILEKNGKFRRVKWDVKKY